MLVAIDPSTSTTRPVSNSARVAGKEWESPALDGRPTAGPRTQDQSNRFLKPFVVSYSSVAERPSSSMLRSMALPGWISKLQVPITDPAGHLLPLPQDTAGLDAFGQHGAMAVSTHLERSLGGGMLVDVKQHCPSTTHDHPYLLDLIHRLCVYSPYPAI